MTIKWERKPIRDIFDIQSGKRILREELREDGPLAFVSSTEKNNGVTKFVSEANANKTLSSNVLAINYNGSLGSCFYHPYKAIFSDDVKILSLKDVQNDRDVLLFFKTLLLKQKNDASYAFKFNANRVMNQEIMVPVGDEGKIDYAYMKKRVGEIFRKKEEAYLKWAEKRLSSMKREDIPALSSVKWGQFLLSDICDISSGEFNINGEEEQDGGGEVPYVTSTAQNNGVSGFVPEGGPSLAKGVISVNRTGSVGKAFYHPYWARFSYNVRILKLKDEKADEGAHLFLCNQLMAAGKSYNYGRLMGTERLAKAMVYLPEKDNRPDFEYMSKYVNNVMIKKYEEYLSWAKTKKNE